MEYIWQITFSYSLYHYIQLRYIRKIISLPPTVIFFQNYSPLAMSFFSWLKINNSKLSLSPEFVVRRLANLILLEKQIYLLLCLCLHPICKKVSIIMNMWYFVLLLIVLYYFYMFCIVALASALKICPVWSTKKKKGGESITIIPLRSQSH